MGEGLTHYYGVGAYRRPLSDVRLAGVKFTPECLGFSHVPEAENLRKLTRNGAVPPHHPDWKRGVPRDTGPGWDFEDIRDFYLELLYGVDPVRLRSEDLDRYLELSRVVTGEVMEAAYSEWRRQDDPCGGALTWFLNDLRPGAGWGLIDSDGEPKAVLYHLRRAWAPVCVRLLDRGLDGVVALVINESAQPVQGSLELLVIGPRGSTIAEAAQEVEVPPRSSLEVGVEGVFGHFLDSTYSYRFGSAGHQAIVARLLISDADGVVVSEDVFRHERAAMTPVNGLDARFERGNGEGATVVLSSDSILYDVRVDVRDHRAQQTHFCLAPGRPKVVRLEGLRESKKSFQGYIEASNLTEAARVTTSG